MHSSTPTRNSTVTNSKSLEENISQKPSSVPTVISPYQDRKRKKTDVNISVRMMADCVQNKVNSIVLVSADTDLIPPLDFILKNYPQIKVKVYFPPSNSSHDIKDFGRANGMKVNDLVNNTERFYRARMQDNVGTYVIPDEWRRKHASAEAYFKRP